MIAPRTLSDELRALHHLLLTMTDRVDAQLANALNALLAQDAAQAERVAEADRTVDALELKIDHQCERIPALYAPVARDLRTLIPP